MEPNDLIADAATLECTLPLLALPRLSASAVVSLPAILTGGALPITTFTSSSAHSADCRALRESDVKVAAMRSYADILALAARNGWNYTPDAIDAGAAGTSRR